MNFNKMNQSHGLSYDETLFLSCQKVPKVKIACSYSKEGDLCWLEELRNLRNQERDCRIKDILSWQNHHHY